MSKKKPNLEKKITDILSKGYEAHYILKRVLQDDTLYVDNKDIIDVIFIPRDSYHAGTDKSSAKLLIATTYGVLFLEESFEEISDDYLGYRMKKIYYHKIDSLDLDICLLRGKFSLFTSGNENFVIEFDTTNFYKQFEVFIATLHDKIVKKYC